MRYEKTSKQTNNIFVFFASVYPLGFLITDIILGFYWNHVVSTLHYCRYSALNVISGLAQTGVVIISLSSEKQKH